MGSASPRFLRLSLGGALEALQRLLHAGGDSFRAKFFQETAPPAWWEDEVSVVLDAAACRVNGCTDDAWFLLQSQGEENMRVELVVGGIDRFDLESEAQAHAREVNSLPGGSRPFRLRALDPDTGPPAKAFPFCEVRPDDFHRGGDNGEGTNAQTHTVFFSIDQSAFLQRCTYNEAFFRCCETVKRRLYIYRDVLG